MRSVSSKFNQLKMLIIMLAVIAAAVGCDQVPSVDQEAEAGSSVLATVSAVNDPQYREDFARGNFALICEGSDKPIALAKLNGDELKFDLTEGATVRDGALCHVNMDIAGADASKYQFFFEPNVYYTSQKSRISANRLSLTVYKAYAAKDRLAVDSFGAKLHATLDGASLTAEQVEKSAVYLQDCGEAERSPIAASVVPGEKGALTIDLAAVPNRFNGKNCAIHLLTKDKQTFTSVDRPRIAAVIGSVEAPVKLLLSIGGQVDVDLEVIGECRAYDNAQNCVFVLPEICAVPLGLKQGSFLAGTWLDCVEKAAGLAARRANTSVQQESTKREILRQAEELMYFRRTFARMSSKEKRPAIEQYVGKAVAFRQAASIDRGIQAAADVVHAVLRDFSERWSE